MRKEIARYECEDDNLNEYTVVEYQHFSTWQPVKGPAKEVPGALEYFLSDGRDVDPLDDNTFRIVNSGLVIRKI